MSRVAGASLARVDEWEFGSVEEAWQRLRDWLRAYFASDHRRARQTALISKRTRGALLALAVGVSIGIHVGLTPEHLREMPRLGDAFIVDATVGAAIAVALVSRPDDRRIVSLAGLFCLAQILAWVLFVTIPVPFFPGTPEPVETIALVSKAVEAVGWVLALWVLRSGEGAASKRSASGYRADASGISST